MPSGSSGLDHEAPNRHHKAVWESQNLVKVGQRGERELHCVEMSKFDPVIKKSKARSRM